MIVSIILSVIGMGVSTMGMKCTNCGGDDKVRKARIAMVGGIVFLIGGESSRPSAVWVELAETRPLVSHPLAISLVLLCVEDIKLKFKFWLTLSSVCNNFKHTVTFLSCKG